MENIGIEKKLLIRTYGCQMNEYDPEVIAGVLTEPSFESTSHTKDIILLNTYVIRENAENKVFDEMEHLIA